MIIEQIATNDLIPYARNSRTHSDEQIAQVAASIREFGFTNPVLIDHDNGIIAGHGRVMAATRLKLDTVPCIRLSHLSDTQKRAYIIADNKLALNSGWDDEMLKLELIELDALGFDVDLIGFDDAELNVFLSDEENDNADYSDKNKEIDVDALEEMMELKFKLTFDEYQEAKERLSEISSTPENALKLLLKMEI